MTRPAVQSLLVALGLPCYPVAQTLPRRDETQFLKKYERRVSRLFSPEICEAEVASRHTFQHR